MGFSDWIFDDSKLQQLIQDLSNIINAVQSNSLPLIQNILSNGVITVNEFNKISNETKDTINNIQNNINNINTKLINDNILDILNGINVAVLIIESNGKNIIKIIIPIVRV